MLHLCEDYRVNELKLTVMVYTSISISQHNMTAYIHSHPYDVIFSVRTTYSILGYNPRLKIKPRFLPIRAFLHQNPIVFVKYLSKLYLIDILYY